jgi:hypothetical protein
MTAECIDQIFNTAVKQSSHAGDLDYYDPDSIVPMLLALRDIVQELAKETRELTKICSGIVLLLNTRAGVRDAVREVRELQGG